MRKKKILIVGQTPPPNLGQAIMIENTINHPYNLLEIFHVRMNFSSGAKEIGKFKLKKVLILITVIMKIFFARVRYNVKNIYYPPAGPDTGPILRDLLILGLTRWMFEKTIYHFRAGGISEKIDSFPPFLKLIILFIMEIPDLTIRLSERNPDDGGFLKTKRDVIIPNGIKDFASNFLPKINKSEGVILFVGAVKKSKGVLDLIRACGILHKRKTHFKLNIIGQVESKELYQEIQQLIFANNLSQQVKLLGTKIEDEKWKEYARANIFCFPSFFECETFGNVVVEAMQFELPVVSTFWRGIPDLVIDGQTGYLVNVNDFEKLADKLEILIQNKKLRRQFGIRGREVFLQKFQEKSYFSLFEKEVYTSCV